MMTYAQAMPILKEIYGPLPHVRGRRYAEVCAWVELRRRIGDRDLVRPRLEAFARRLGLEYEVTNPIDTMMYAEHPFFDLLGMRSKRRTRVLLRDSDIGPMPRLRSRFDGDARAPFTPEEAEDRRQSAMWDRGEDPGPDRLGRKA